MADDSKLRRQLDAFFRGAFAAWLEGRLAGEELHLVEESEGVYLQVSTTETAQGMRYMAHEGVGSRRPRQKGARALQHCLAGVRYVVDQEGGADA